MDENPFAYMNNYSEEEKQYTGRLDAWLMNTFMNTSSAPRNNRPWFNRCIANTLDTHVGKGEPVVIGLTGLAGSGKDSAINYLHQHEGDARDLRVTCTAFASPLKEIARIVGFTRNQLYKRDLKEKTDDFWGISPRQFLQMCGTEMFRKVWRDDIWVKITQKRLEELKKVEMETELRFGGPASTGKYRLIFVTDVRFPNEAKMIKDIGGYVFRVERPDSPNHISETHDSERFIQDLQVDKVIQNTAPNAEEWSWTFAKEMTRYFESAAFYR